jgi:putative oxidoreductase
MTAETGRRLERALAVVFGAVFVFSGCVKAWDPTLFLIAIRGFRILPDPFAAWLALGLPWLEVFSGLAVMCGWLKRGGLLVLNACLAVFVIMIVVAWARGLDVACGCFGDALRLGTKVELGLDLVLLVAGLWLMRRRISFP